MTDPLPRLLKSYEFLKQALAQYGGRMAEHEVARLREQRDQVFHRILTFDASDPRVTGAQLHFMIENLPRLAGDPEALRTVQKAAGRHLDRLLRSRSAETPKLMARPNASGGRSRNRFDPEKFRTFDHLNDRVGIIDRGLRFLYTNAANARFHRQSAGAFVGSPYWQMTGRTFFDRVSAPKIEAGFAGKRSSCLCRNANWRDLVQLASFEPLRDEGGEIFAVMIMSKDVTHLPIPETDIVSA
ncbi:MAG: PAS domain-containing protein [Hyphomicrobiaceae bacterium]